MNGGEYIIDTLKKQEFLFHSFLSYHICSLISKINAQIYLRSNSQYREKAFILKFYLQFK